MSCIPLEPATLFADAVCKDHEYESLLLLKHFLSAFIALDVCSSSWLGCIVVMLIVTDIFFFLLQYFCMS